MKLFWRIFAAWVLAILITCALLSPSVQAETSDKDPVKIGALMVLTGQFAMQGAAFREGIELAESEVNQAGGINGRPLKVIIEDTHGLPQGAATSARKLLDVDKVSAALTMSYPDTKVGGSLFQAARVPSIALWDSSPEIDQMGDFIFALGPWAPSTGEQAAQFGFNRLTARSAVIVNTVEEWSTYVSDYFTSKFTELGGKILKRYEINPEDGDFRTVISAVKQQQPDLVFAPLTHNIVPFFKQSQQMKIGSKIITGSILTKEHIDQAVSAFEGVYRSEIRDPDNQISQSLFSKYQQRFKKPVTLPWYVATGYDAVKLLAEALGQAGKDSVKVKESLYSVKGFPGASKEITISKGGSSPTYEKMFQIRGGEFYFLE